jgi:hypothetical protein
VHQAPLRLCDTRETPIPLFPDLQNMTNTGGPLDFSIGCMWGL